MSSDDPWSSTDVSDAAAASAASRQSDSPNPYRFPDSAMDNLTLANYRSLVESLPLFLLIKDAQGRRLYANQAYLRYRNMTAQELMGKRDEDLFSPEIAANYREDDQRVMQTGEPIQGIEQTQSAAGELHWVERYKCPLRDPQGNICGVQLLFWDVTARVQAEQHRDQERQWLQTLLDNMPDSIYFKDRESRFIRVGAGMAKKFNLSDSSQVIGLSDADIFTPEHAVPSRLAEQEIMRTGKPMINRIERETWPDREDTWCTSTKLPLRDAAGNIIGTFGISRDITDLKKVQDELARARDAADQANRAKSDFLANMSHEIRTPMNAIIGMSELLAQTPLTREQRDFLQLVREAADSLLRLLNDILDFSKIEASKLELESIPFSLRDCIGRTGHTLSLRAAQKGLELVCRVAPDIPDRIIGDPGRLRQILINLIGNALKFTDQGEVFVDVSLDADSCSGADAAAVPAGSPATLPIAAEAVQLSSADAPPHDAPPHDAPTHDAPSQGPSADAAPGEEAPAGEGRASEAAGEAPAIAVGEATAGPLVAAAEPEPEQAPPRREGDAEEATGRPIRLRFSVRDTGIGIPPDQQAHVLEAFSQGDTSTTRRFGGTGLGLTISAQLAQLMGGKLWLQSEVGVGTTFHFTAVFDVARRQGAAQAAALTTLNDLPVLVVDDNATNRRIMQEVFTAWRLRPTLVPDARQALHELQLAENRGQPYRLAVLDCMMPEMDGFELATRIRQQFDSQALRLIILSSAARLGDSEQCQRIGVSRYLTKPVIQSELLDAVLQVMHVVDIEPPSPETPLPECPALKILLAEDGLANQVVARGMLQAAGHEVVIAADGREAVQRWAAEPFDVILMDMHMPELDGLEATREIRRCEQERGLRPIPIVAITAAAMSEDTRLCLDAGMDAFLSKPVQGNLLYETLATLARRMEQPTVAAASQPPATTEPPRTAEEPAAATVANTPAATHPECGLADDVINLADAMRRLPGGLPAMRRLVEVFQGECQSLVSQLAEAVAEQDVRQVQYLAHTLKGSANLLGAARLGATAFELDRAAKEDRRDELPRLFEVLQEDAAQVQAALDAFMGGGERA